MNKNNDGELLMQQLYEKLDNIQALYAISQISGPISLTPDQFCELGKIAIILKNYIKPSSIYAKYYREKLNGNSSEEITNLVNKRIGQYANEVTREHINDFLALIKFCVDHLNTERIEISSDDQAKIYHLADQMELALLKVTP